MKKLNEEDLGTIVAEILEEKSIIPTSFGDVYFKHFSQLDSRRILIKKDFYKSEGEKKGIPSNASMFHTLIDEGMWSFEEEKSIESLEQEIENLSKAINQIKIPSKRHSLNKIIKEKKLQLLDQQTEKEKLFGLTSEKYSENKINKEFLNSILFFDEDYKESVFDSLYYNEKLKEREVYIIQKNIFEKFSDENISRSALCPFFAPYIAYCEDVLGLFGKPLSKLTTYQIKLISYGRTFLNIFKNCPKDIPENVSKDPELLMSFHEAAKNNKNTTRASDGDGGTTYFGATKEDISVMKSDEAVIDLRNEVKKRGGSMTMKEMMELHGV